MKVRIKSKFRYIIISFAAGFVLNILGMTFEDFKHNISISESLSEIHHYITPLLIGIIAGIFAYFYWKRKAQQLKEVNRFTENLNSLLDVNKALVSSIDLDTVLQLIIDKSTQLINLDTGAIYLHEDKKLYLGATTPPLPPQFPEILRYDLLENHPHIQKSLETKLAVIVPDASQATLSEAEQAVVKVRNLHSILYIPLIIENRPVGTLILGTTNSLRSFSDHEIDLYRTFSGQAALSIENARLYKKSIQIADELRQQNEEFLSLNEELSDNNLRIQKINEDLNVAKAKAEESDRLKTAFLQNMSHEVRTPLNAIVGFSQLLIGSNQPVEKIAKFSNIISSNSNKLIEIISDVIQISQIQAHSSFINKSEFDFIQAVGPVIGEFESKSSEKEISVITNLNVHDHKHIISSDESKIIVIFRHILDNAVKFTQKGQIKLDFNLQPDSIQFVIADTGIGISKDMQQKIFEPFRQIELGMCRNYGGNGLGLAIVKSYLEMLDGTINLQSELHIGTSISVTIPAIQILKNEISGINNQKQIFSSNTILIVEDELSNYEYLFELLSETNAKIIHASNGQVAIDICKENDQIDFILMDIKMPVMDGHTATKMIKAFRPDLPIIAQTAYVFDSDKEQFLKSGFDDFIAKPISEEILFKTICKYIGK